MTIYLTTDLQTENSHFLNSAANAMLSPVRYLFGGRTVWIVDNTTLSAELPEPKRSWLKTAGMIAALVPGVLFGALTRLLSCAIQEVRTGLLLVPAAYIQVPQEIRQEAPSVDIDHLPIESVVHKDIAFFKELLAVPDDQLKAWLESKKTDRNYINPFHGASVIAESRVFFNDVDSSHMTELLELFGKAAERLQKLEAAESLVQSAHAVKKPEEQKPKAPKHLSTHLLDMFKKVKPVLSEKEFADLCKKYGHDSKVVLATIQDYERKVRLQRLADVVICFFLDLRAVPDKMLPQWLSSQKASKKYPYPFTLAADSIKQKAFYLKILGNAALTDLHEHYIEASARLSALGLQVYLDEKNI